MGLRTVLKNFTILAVVCGQPGPTARRESTKWVRASILWPARWSEAREYSMFATDPCNPGERYHKDDWVLYQAYNTSQWILKLKTPPKYSPLVSDFLGGNIRARYLRAEFCIDHIIIISDFQGSRTWELDSLTISDPTSYSGETSPRAAGYSDHLWSGKRVR